MVALTGNPDGTSEVDYTVNPATGFPWATGPRNMAEPLNSILPAWDIAMGTLAAFGLLAADRHRGQTGRGRLVRLAPAPVVRGPRPRRGPGPPRRRRHLLGPYQAFRQLVDEDSRCSVANPLFEEVEHLGLGSYLMPGSPLWFDDVERLRVAPAPRLGEHTEPILADLLGLSATEIGRLFRRPRRRLGR